MFDEISGEQKVQTIGHRPLDEDSVVIDYSLQSIGNSDTRYLAGVMQPAITSGSIAGASLATNDVSFIPMSGKFASCMPIKEKACQILFTELYLQAKVCVYRNR
jgi:hypothetical protein